MLLMKFCIVGTPADFGSLLKMTICDVRERHRYAILSEGVCKRTAICCRSSRKWLLQVRPFATVYFTFLAFQCCQMLSKKQPWPWPITFEKKKRVYPNWPNIATKFVQDEARIKVCFFQIGPAGTPQLLPRSGRNLRALGKVQLLQGRIPQDFQQVRGPIGTGFKGKAPGVLERGRMGIYSPAGGWHIEKGTFMPCKPQSSKNLAFVRGRPYYHLDGAKCKIPEKIKAW